MLVDLVEKEGGREGGREIGILGGKGRDKERKGWEIG